MTGQERLQDGPSSFYDAFWRDCYNKVRTVAPRDSDIVGPSEFAAGFASYYIYEYRELCEAPDFVIVHKGLIREIGVAFLKSVKRDLAPLFANEVFVVFGRSGAADPGLDTHLLPYFAMLEDSDDPDRGREHRSLGDLLNEGRFSELRRSISSLSPMKKETRDELIEISFRAKDWGRLYALTYDDSGSIDFNTQLLHCYASTCLGVGDELVEAFAERIQSFDPRYDTQTLRLLELSSLRKDWHHAAAQNSRLAHFIELHCIAGNYDWIDADESLQIPANDPIDAVYTWVDPTDPDWARLRQKYTSTFDSELTGEARFGDIGEVYLSINLLVLNAPFIRHIYVVTSGQSARFKLDRLSDAARFRIKFVDHEDFLRKNILRPTFNSDVIESCFDRIDGLSETFLYLNDDCFLAKTIKKTDLFVADGRPRILANHKIWKKEDRRIRGATPSDRDSRTLICFMEKFGSPPRFTPAHQMMICNKQSIARMWEVFPYEMEKYVAPHRMRDYTSLQFLKLAAWVADRERRQVATIVAADREIFRRGISSETLTAARRDHVYYYSLNNMNGDSEDLFKRFGEILLAKHMDTPSRASPDWSA